MLQPITFTHRVRGEHSHKGNGMWMSQVLDGLTIQWLGGTHFAYIYIYMRYLIGSQLELLRVSQPSNSQACFKNK